MQRRTASARDQRRQPKDSTEHAVVEPATPRGGVAGSLLQLQRQIGNRAVCALLQRHCYEDFDTLREARAASIYAKARLRSQEGDSIFSHERMPFSPKEREAVLQVNEEENGVLRDDVSGRLLQRQDMEDTPHVDHRYPKSKGGTNSFLNARVISASENLTKGSKTTRQLPKGAVDENVHEREPTRALPQYAGLDDSNHTIMVGGGFSGEQRAAILAANKEHYGVVKSDMSNVELPGVSSADVAHVDHVLDRGSGGCSFYFNAQVLSAASNTQKSGRRRTFDDGEEIEERSDWSTGELTLKQYYDRKNGNEQKATRKRKEPDPTQAPASRTRSKMSKEPVTKKRGVDGL